MNFLQNHLYIIPFITGFVCFTSTIITLYVLLLPSKGFLSKRLPSLFKQLEESEVLQPQKLESAIAPLLEEKISELLVTITSQIPMGSMLLSGSLGKNIKDKAKKAVLEALPELKEKGLWKGEQLAVQKWSEHGKAILFKYGTLVALFSGLIGVICGLLLWVLALYTGF